MWFSSPLPPHCSGTCRRPNSQHRQHVLLLHPWGRVGQWFCVCACSPLGSPAHFSPMATQPPCGEQKAWCQNHSGTKMFLSLCKMTLQLCAYFGRGRFTRTGERCCLGTGQQRLLHTVWDYSADPSLEISLLPSCLSQFLPRCQFCSFFHILHCVPPSSLFI